MLSSGIANYSIAQIPGRQIPVDPRKTIKPATGKTNGTGKIPPVITKIPPKVTTPKSLSGQLKMSATEDCTVSILDVKYELKKGVPKLVLLSNGTYKLTAKIASSATEFNGPSVTINGKDEVVQLDLTAFKNDENKKAAAKVDISKKPDEPIIITRTEPSPEITSPVSVAIKEIMEGMISIEPKVFTMGTGVGNNGEAPTHMVSLSQFDVSKYEVTQKQWQMVMGTNPSINKGCDNCPVENVSYNEIEAFLKKLYAQSKVKFRLPTEAEWEYLAQSTAKNAKGIAWYASNSEKKTHPVGTKSSNDLQIYDLTGNVAEWCSDWYDLNFYKKTLATNPAGPIMGKEKAVRGGSFDDSENGLRYTKRDKLNPGSKNGMTGFRLVIGSK